MNDGMTQLTQVHTLIIGSGAAGLCAAVRLRAEGVKDILIATEGLDMGTSINTGSDKQTYYKLSLCGDQSDSPRQVAQTLFDGGSMHGDIALIEAALSARCFLHLANLGVKFPTDAFGQFVGYKTDHDPRQRATSVGPYTSRDMCRALIQRVKELRIPFWENVHCVELLTYDESIKEPGTESVLQRSPRTRRVCGAIFEDADGDPVPVIAENVVFAVGGPGDLYETSVYPQSQTSSIGLALKIGAEAQNLPESQFGMASTKFRWNVSGTYMQVVPRFVSTDMDGNDPKEFLTEYFDDLGDLCSKIFLKGYQWPFDVRKVVLKSRGRSEAQSPDTHGSSIIDILVYIETVERWRRVFLDFRSNPTGFSRESLSDEAKNYLEKSNALFGTPIERLETMNPGAIELYAANGIDLRNEMLEIAVCAQHNNGGLAGSIWWESTNVKHLFPIGEVNGSHGVARPGGSALNSGQVGAFRAAEYIANRYKTWTVDVDRATETAKAAVADYEIRDEISNCGGPDFMKYRRRMSQFGAAIRNLDGLETAVHDAWASKNRVGEADSFFQFDRILAHAVYLDAILFAVRSGIGSRGSGMVLQSGSTPIHPKLDPAVWSMQPEDFSYREKVLVSRFDPETGKVEHRWESRRPIPESDTWFETAWKAYRNGEVYGE